MSPVANLSPLQRADGSASYSSGGYSVLAAVNGPIEVQRRDELPQEAAIDVIIRPAAGVGGNLEELIISRDQADGNLRSTRAPLGIHHSQNTSLYGTGLSTPSHAHSGCPASDSYSRGRFRFWQIASGGLATSIAVSPLGTLTRAPTPKQRQAATSQHVLAFTSHGDLLVAESEGRFDMDEWEKVVAEAVHVCRGGADPLDEDVSMDSNDSGSLEGFVRDIVQAKVTTDQRWKESNR
ncbi:MAG: hypothetical protein Q9187_000824 [Circinaria calcarea]